ncbi:hypothetical protein CASFOL_007489 [Castilleja foliolosa]|uniref:Uncharacterized protein n=1 Tax=Castilleja foliolosa TaxID=1961234 RepID=A0ABD3ED72_9LAMI
MASMVAENWGYVDGRDCSEDIEFSQINHNFLMSLLDETQIDDCDDEKLKKFMRSLEAEINYDGQCGFDNMTIWESDLVDCQSSIDESTGQDDHLMQGDDFDHWMDVETMPTSPSDGQRMGVNEFSWVQNYAPICSVTPFDQEQDYGSLWHETNVTM